MLSGLVDALKPRVRRVVLYVLRSFPGFWRAIAGIGLLYRPLNRFVINLSVNITRRRPHAYSTLTSYTSWSSLTDKTYLGRHLPAKVAPADLPSVRELTALFRRPEANAPVCPKSTLLFPVFAQYLTDGFLRTNMNDRRRTTSNHDIDLSPLYGLNKTQTDVLRERSDAPGRRGRMKAQIINGEAFPPDLYEADGVTVRAEFCHPQTGAPLLDLPIGFRTVASEKGEAMNGHDRRIFAVGGDRANATPLVAMMNTVFLREHNRLAGELEGRNPTWDDERVFQTARAMVIVIFIKIVVEEYINHISSLAVPLTADPSGAWTAPWNRPNWMTVEFSLLYRWHPMIPDEMTWKGARVHSGRMVLDNRYLTEVGLTEALRMTSATHTGVLGLGNTASFLLPVEEAAIQQGRDQQLPPYNDYREMVGLARARTFADITAKPERQRALAALYGTPDRVDFYVGLFAEDVNPNTPMPTLIGMMVALDAFSQALNNPLLSEHVFNAKTFTDWGFKEIQKRQTIADLIARQAGREGEVDPAIVMTRSDWRRGPAMF